MNEEKEKKRKISRRAALKYMSAGVLGAAGIYFGIKNKEAIVQKFSQFDSLPAPDGEGKVTTRKDKILNSPVSLLGFGCMRLPLKEEGKTDIDEEKAMAMVDYAYQHGVNYFDTAWFYHQGMSETFIGKAMKKYPRDSFYMVTKMPGRIVESLEHAKQIFEQQLQKCQVEYFDFYMLHSVSTKENYQKVYHEYGVLDYLLLQKKEGRIRRLGISFHGVTEEFPWFLDQHKWDFCMIQANYYDWKVFSEFLYSEATKRDIQCVIMEPVRGGMLANLTPQAAKVFTDTDPNRSIASWAVQYIASLPNVMTVLSGMTTMEQVQDNVKTLTDFKPMSTAQYEVVERALKTFLTLSPVPCTECQYCMPCPFGVNIPGSFHAYNKSVTEGAVPNLRDSRDSDFERRKQAFLANMNTLPESAQPTGCTNCKVCLNKCPQKIEIANKFKEISQLMKELKK
ncbi:MAG: aldo/keto reductase [Bacteroidales bacterium]|jgi:predicted aldo/keto reductase-like oxidoreductase|nr:aldo/keto reductase [Bacteroidales bacterium]